MMDDRDLAYLTAIDPHAATTTKPWEIELRSRYLQYVAAGWVLFVLAVHIFMAAVVDVEYTGVGISGIDKFAFVGVGLIISLVSVSYTHLTLPTTERV